MNPHKNSQTESPARVGVSVQTENTDDDDEDDGDYVDATDDDPAYIFPRCELANKLGLYSSISICEKIINICW